MNLTEALAQGALSQVDLEEIIFEFLHELLVTHADNISNIMLREEAIYAIRHPNKAMSTFEKYYIC